MTSIEQFSQQAELAQAAYAIVTKGMFGDDEKYIDALKGANMSQSQAEAFAAEWTVVDSAEFDNGAAATIFKNVKTGVCYLAVRGTEPSDAADYAADAFLAAGFSSYTNPQFWSLEDQVQEWINDGDLPASFTVTGHSLGGYLATPGC